MGFNRRDNDRRGGRSFGGGNRRSFGGGGGRSFGGGRDRNRDSGDREMHSAVCDNCGKDCQVPFRPTSGKPVLCSDCFEKKGGANRSERGRDFNRGGNGSNDSKKLLDKVNSLEAKLDKILTLLGNSTEEVPVTVTEEVSATATEEKPVEKKSAAKPKKKSPKTVEEPQVETSEETTTEESVETTDQAVTEIPIETPETTK